MYFSKNKLSYFRKDNSNVTGFTAGSLSVSTNLDNVISSKFFTFIKS